jgi:uncharacterized protein YigE (DUF2233 family)
MLSSDNKTPVSDGAAYSQHTNNSRLSLLICLVALWIAACDSKAPLPAKVAPSWTPAPSQTPIPDDTHWRSIQPGLEYREVKVTNVGRSDRLRIARVDPVQVQLRVLYDPNQARRVSDWLVSTPSLLVVNGNYFDPQNQTLGLVIGDGVRAGFAYQGFGGMFAVSDDTVRVRANATEPYVEGERLAYALQNFPMLVLPDGQPNMQIDDNGARAPRTAVAQDRSGRIVFVVSPSATFSLTEFGQWLAASDLNLDVALNLDGGTSSGLLIRNGDRSVGIDSWVSVPSVIVAEPK